MISMSDFADVVEWVNDLVVESTVSATELASRRRKAALETSAIWFFVQCARAYTPTRCSQIWYLTSSFYLFAQRNVVMLFFFFTSVLCSSFGNAFSWDHLHGVP